MLQINMILGGGQADCLPPFLFAFVKTAVQNKSETSDL